MNRTDTERLEWLATRDCMVAHSRDGDSCWLVWPHGREYEDNEMERQEGSYGSIREAIDAEMDKE